MRLFLLLVILLPSLVMAQSKGWQELSISDGLSQGMIYDLKQDQNGFIWVATKDGLNRYDGHNFTIFAHDPYNPFSLSDNTCSALLVDRGGRLWVGTLNQGLNLYDTHTQRFYHIDIHDQAVANAGNYEVRWIAEAPDGTIWVSTNKNQLFTISLPPNLRTNFPDKPNFSGQVHIRQMTLPGNDLNGRVYHAHFQSDGRAVLGTTYGLYALSWRQPGRITPLNRVLGESINFDSMSDDFQAGYWFSARWNSIHGWYRGVHKAIPFSERIGRTVKVKFIDRKTVAVASNDYLWLMSPAELMRQDSLTARNAFAAMPANLFGISSLLKDQSGLIWIGTEGYGLQKFNPGVNQFHSSLPGQSLSYLFQDRQGRTYVRRGFRYSQADLATNQLKPLPDKQPLFGGLTQHFLMQDRQGDFWVLYDDEVRYRYHLVRFSSRWAWRKKYTLPPSIRFADYVGSQMLEDKTGQFWIGAANGKLIRFDPVTETMRVYSYAHVLPQSGSVIETHALYFDQAGTLWIGTTRGLVRTQTPLKRPVFTAYRNAETDRRSLSHDFVSCILDDPFQPDRYLWVSTKGGGLERLDKQSQGQFTHFTQARGLPNKVVYGMLSDEFNNFWLSTNRGLSRFNPKTLTFRNYTKADGLQDDEFNTGSFGKAPSGDLLFGGVNGLTVFRAKEIMGNGPVPQAHIIGLRVNNEPVAVGEPDGILPQSIEHTRQLDVSHQQNMLTFESGVMDYTNPAKNQYRYRLEGVDEKWVEAGTNRFANYTNLSDGFYRFEMMGSADGQVWSKPVVLQIRVHPPFYRTWWAYLLYTIILVVLGWQWHRFQTQRLLLQQQVAFEQKEASRLSELDALKTRFFTNISHEFRTPLTLILGPLADLKQRFPAESLPSMDRPIMSLLGVMERNGNRLLGLINQLLDLSKLEAGELKADPEPGDMASFFRTLASAFTSLADSRAIHFTFEQDQLSYWATFDRDKIEKIVTNLLGNAFKFTPNGNEVAMTVSYQTEATPHALVLSVSDTGIGIAAANLLRIFDRFYQLSIPAVAGKANRYYEGTGIGLALVHELVRLLNGTIAVASTEGVGTTFTVTLPLAGIEPPQPETPVMQLVARHVSAQGMELLTNQVIPSSATSLPPSASLPRSVSENLLLIIDDNADIRAYVRSIFADEYQIVEAVDGLDGLERAKAMLPDMVICDLMMPRLDGFGFCRALKTGEATSHIPVVMLTAKATIEDRIEGFDLGADDYLTKPFNRDEIQARVRNLLRQRVRLSAYFSQRLGLDQPLNETMVSREDMFLQKARTVVMEHLVDRSFGVELFSEALHMSQRQVVRKLKALTDQTAVEFIRNLRLERAADQLRQGNHTVSDVAYAVGFDSLPYFTRVFQEKFGVLPSVYAHQTERS